MANLSGEVDFVVEGETYTLLLTSYEIDKAENLLGLGIVQISMALSDPVKLRAGHINAMIWAGLREHHPDIDLKAAARLVTKFGLKPALEVVLKAIQDAFGIEEGKEPPSPNRAARRKVGTGKRS